MSNYNLKSGSSSISHFIEDDKLTTQIIENTHMVSDNWFT